MVSQISGVEAAAAELALDGAGGEIKLAVLTARGTEPAQAASALRAAGGDLRVALARLADAG
jgi:N-acetylmuramic acid 6-phosphate (MurNAc-6-P) etherase